MVTDTIRLDATSVPTPAWYAKEELPRSPEGELHYLLEGSIAAILAGGIGFMHSPSTRGRGPHGLLVKEGDRSTFDRWVAHALFSEDYEHEPPPAQSAAGMIWLSGVVIGGKDGMWMPFSKDQPMFDTTPYGDSYYVFEIDYEKQVPPVSMLGRHLSIESFEPRDRTITLPAGTFRWLSGMDIRGDGGLADDFSMVFARDVGLVWIGSSGGPITADSENGFHVLTKFHRGVTTSVRTVTWGQAKGHSQKPEKP